MRNQKAFTIVELLIVIVVIAILAAITIVAYNGIQQRARDAERSQELGELQKALEFYHADKGGYPACGGTTPYSPGTTSVYGSASACLTSQLVPTYIAQLPTDPMNTGSYQYWYGVGYTKVGATSYTGSQTDNYILATKQETVSSPVFSGWGRTDLTLLLGSSN